MDMKNNIFYAILFCLSFGLFSCETTFDNLEGDLSRMTGEDMVSTSAGIERLLSYLYQQIPMTTWASSDKSTLDATDNFTASYGGRPTSFWSYSVIRSINNFIIQIGEAKDKNIISESEYKTALGEALFIRAYCYFASVRAYGGIPIVDQSLDDKYDGAGNEGLYIPRSTEKESWDFVLSELDEAIAALPETNTGGRYRADKWAALGLKSRVALYAASVSKYWNNAPIESSYTAVSKQLTYMEPSYANGYYDQCIDACEQIISSGRFSLYMPMPASVAEATHNYHELFMSRQDCEWLFGRSYNNGVSTSSNGFDANNSPTQSHPSGYWQWGRTSITLDMVDAYDNYDAAFGGIDGTIKTRVDGDETFYVAQPKVNFNPSIDYIKYDSPDAPFVNKDARFQASVIYPDCQFRGITIKIQGGIISPAGDPTFYVNIPHTLNGITYWTFGAELTTDCSGFFKMDDLPQSNWYSTGFGIRKYLDESKPIDYSQNPWYDIRFTEILLNYCEAQVEKNGTNAGLSKTYLNQIRRRAYFLDEREATLENILKERRIELAFEDDRQQTLHRRREFVAAGVRKHALVPVVDLRGSEAKWIFVRANNYPYDTDKTTGLTYLPIEYYGGIPNYVVNKIDPNPIQE